MAALFIATVSAFVAHYRLQNDFLKTLISEKIMKNQGADSVIF
jgi:hypothetical protein